MGGVEEAGEGRHSRLEVGWGEAALRVGEWCSAGSGRGPGRGSVKGGGGRGEAKRSGRWEGHWTASSRIPFHVFLFPDIQLFPQTTETNLLMQGNVESQVAEEVVRWCVGL